MCSTRTHDFDECTITKLSKTRAKQQNICNFYRSWKAQMTLTKFILLVRCADMHRGKNHAHFTRSLHVIFGNFSMSISVKKLFNRNSCGKPISFHNSTKVFFQKGWNFLSLGGITNIKPAYLNPHPYLHPILNFNLTSRIENSAKNMVKNS